MYLAATDILYSQESNIKIITLATLVSPTFQCLLPCCNVCVMHVIMTLQHSVSEKDALTLQHVVNYCFMVLQQYRSILNVHHRTETVTSPGQLEILHPIHLDFFVAKKQHSSLFIFIFLCNLLLC